MSTESGKPWEAQPIADEPLGARVRWRAGTFLALNDLAYSHGGRIHVPMSRHR